jgi:hypothetical protein
MKRCTGERSAGQRIAGDGVTGERRSGGQCIARRTPVRRAAGERRPGTALAAGPRIAGRWAGLIALPLLVLLGIVLAAGNSQAQTAGAASLTITPGARADGMGRAFVALPTDATANFWNPAALAYQKGRVFGLMHARLVPDLADDVYYENLGYAMHLPGWGGVGASVVYLSYGKSMAMDENGIEGGLFTSYEISPQVHIGTEVLKGLGAGLTLKYVYVNLAPAWATTEKTAGAGDTFAADFGLLLRVQDMFPSLLPVPVSLGVNVQNLGPNIAYIDQAQSDPIGRNLKIGIGAQVLNLPKVTGILAYDFNQSLVGTMFRFAKPIETFGPWFVFYNVDKPVHNVGAELTYGDFVSLRGGYIYDKQGDVMDPTFGIGFVIPLGVNNLGVDYASVPQARVLDRVDKFSLTFRF